MRSYEGRIGLKTEAVNWRLELRERREDLTQRGCEERARLGGYAVDYHLDSEEDST